MKLPRYSVKSSDTAFLGNPHWHPKPAGKAIIAFELDLGNRGL
jgi:hypothetical protein